LRVGICGLGFGGWSLGFWFLILDFGWVVRSCSTCAAYLRSVGCKGIPDEWLRFGVWGLRLRVLGFGFWVWGLEFGVWSLGFGVWGLGFGV